MVLFYMDLANSLGTYVEKVKVTIERNLNYKLVFFLSQKALIH